MLDEQVDERIRLTLDDRRSDQRPATEPDPVGAVRARVSRRRRRRRGAMAASVVLVGSVAVLAMVLIPRDAAQDLETADESSSADSVDPVPPDPGRNGAEEPRALDEGTLNADDDLPIRVDASPTLDSLLAAVVDNRGALTVTDHYEWRFGDGTRSLFVYLEDPSGVLVNIAVLNSPNENAVPDELTKRYPDGASPFAELRIMTFAPPNVDPGQFRSHDALADLFAAVDAWVLER